LEHLTPHRFDDKPQDAFTSLGAPQRAAVAQRAAALLGAACFPLIGKAPALSSSWPSLIAQVDNTDIWEEATGFSLVPPKDSLLTLVDLDSPDFAVKILQLLPQIEQSAGSRRGPNQHRYIKLSRPLQQAYITKRDEQGQELGSLRGHGAYVVGPGSLHPSGDTYIPIPGPVIELDEFDTLLLLNAFGTDTDEHRPRLHSHPFTASTGTLEDIAQELTARFGFKPSGTKGWLGGHCPFAATHKDGTDNHPSGTFHPHRGIYNCFACGRHQIAEVAQTLGLRYLPAQSKQRPTFQGHLHREPGLPVEINISTTLQALGLDHLARFHPILWATTRRRQGHHTFTTQEIEILCHAYKIAPHDAHKMIQSALSIGMLRKTNSGDYVLRGIRALKELLGLDRERFAYAELPRSSANNAHDFKLELFLAASHFLPAQDLSSRQRAHCLGVARATLYRYENELEVERQKRIEGVSRELAPTQAHLIAIVGSNNQTRLILPAKDWRGDFDDWPAQRLMGEGERLFYLKQLPSKRVLPPRNPLPKEAPP